MAAQNDRIAQLVSTATKLGLTSEQIQELLSALAEHYKTKSKGELKQMLIDMINRHTNPAGEPTAPQAPHQPQQNQQAVLEAINRLQQDQQQMKALIAQQGVPKNTPAVTSTPVPVCEDVSGTVMKSTGTVVASYLSNKQNFDQKKADEYLQEFDLFTKKMQVRALGGGSTSDESMSSILDNQVRKLSANIVKVSNDPNAKTEIQKGFSEILRLGNKAVDLFEKKNIQFLIDARFLSKVDYLKKYEKYLAFEEEQEKNKGLASPPSAQYRKSGGAPPSKVKYSEAVRNYYRDVIDKFYNRIETIISTNFKIEGAEDKEELERLRDDLFEKLSKSREKLYALYNNKVSIMDTLNQTFVAVYLLKVVRLGFAFFAMYTASKILQQQYVNNVFANNQDPPDLRLFLIYYWGIELIFIIGLMIFLVLLKFLFDRQGDFIINGYLIMKFTQDYIISSVLILILGIIIASVIMQKKYFKYKTDGLRAIRANQDILFYVVLVINFIPFFLIGF